MARFRSNRNHRHSRSFLSSPLLLGLMLGLGTAAGVASFIEDGSAISSPLAAIGSGCNIKGNISINTGERIYHVPGQEYYNATRISSQYGERWFCSEAEARKAGWRKARR